jgi:transposase
MGSGRLLSIKQENAIVELIKGTFPDAHGITLSVWSRKAVAELIFHKFKICIAVRTVGDYLKRWGFSPQKPAKRAYQRNDEDVAQFKSETIPSIIDRAKAEDGIVAFADETGIHSENFNASSFSPIGVTPVIERTGSRFKLNAIMAIASNGCLKFMTYCQSMNGGLFIDFLRSLIRSAKGKKVFLVVDNLRVHHGKRVREWLKNYEEKLELVFLPPYCPDLNPVEYLNNILKESLQKRIQAHNNNEFRQYVYEELKMLQAHPQKITAIFNHKQLRYISQAYDQKDVDNKGISKHGLSKLLNNKDKRNSTNYPPG